MNNVPETFGSLVFNAATMKARLPSETYASLKRTMEDGRHLDLSVAHVVANAMKDWAVEHGATHYTHWFQPMTGITAEKHDSFISPAGDGRVIMEFSGKELVQGEPDASSLPSGGLRATFEARGYTAWDPTAYAFIKGSTLYIPTVFCSYSGEALDQKTPLMRSMETLGREALRVIRLFGSDAARVFTSAGPEQEYFLVDKEMYDRRPDLIFTGRTLYGTRALKGQELDDHYFGAIQPRVKAFMTELDEELWKLGVLAKTEHNETAPAQHELAPIYRMTNKATDDNQLTMEMMQEVAKRHGLVCLLHEKPFEGVNGSGKHNNWSLSTNTGVNLLSPGETPHENAQFLLFLCAVIKAVDDYQVLLRISVADAGNDHRLGASEAPPAIVSVFLGDELTAILDAIKNDTPYLAEEKSVLRLGVHVLPKLPKDTTDRNRTSPFAFTGNKFEFRMLGASSSISLTNTIINTSVAESLRLYADEIEARLGKEALADIVHDLIKRTIEEHGRIIFNGNGYDDAWKAEAMRRGLRNFPTTADCVPHLLDRENIELLTRHKVYSESELRSRHDVMLGNYCSKITIEARTMLEMAKRDIIPAVSRQIKTLAETVNAARAVCPNTLDCETETVSTLSALVSDMRAACAKLETQLSETAEMSNIAERAMFFKRDILSDMDTLRSAADSAEALTDRTLWPYPTYGDLLYGVR
jgi:glutamine synthetase